MSNMSSKSSKNRGGDILCIRRMSSLNVAQMWKQKLYQARNSDTVSIQFIFCKRENFSETDWFNSSYALKVWWSLSQNCKVLSYKL